VGALGFAGQQVTPRDQLVTAHLGIIANAKGILAKGLGAIIMSITYAG